MKSSKPNNYSLDRSISIGIKAAGYREEFDSMGKVNVPADRYWGAQTQRSLQHFNIGNNFIPKEFYHAYGYIKKAYALVNFEASRLSDWKRMPLLLQRMKLSAVN